MASILDTPGKTSRLVAGQYPPPGTDPVADRIRERRGARGLTPLDANLLHFPAMASGYNDLLAALRTGGRLPGDVRELMILRIAALNGAAFEWIQHESIGRAEGLTTGQLYIIRDTTTPLPPMSGMLSPLQSISLEFTDAVTRDINFTIDVGQKYKAEIGKWLEREGRDIPGEDLKKKVEDLYVEASMIVAGYNMVSRFLVATDVNRLTGAEVPWPLERHELSLHIPSYSYPPEQDPPSHLIHTIALKHAVLSDRNVPPKWIVFANSLLVDWRMWNWVIPYFIDGGLRYDVDGNGSSSSKQPYNLILHSQRGHGKSNLPSPPAGDDVRQTTIPLLAQDIQNILLHPEIRTIIDGEIDAHILNPIHTVIGVSQGGAAALAFGATFASTLSPAAATTSIPGRMQAMRTTRSIVVCDTSAQTPAGNKVAWAERVQLVYGGGRFAAGGSSSHTTHSAKSEKITDLYAEAVGMRELSNLTVPRWFPQGSPLPQERDMFIRHMVTTTDVRGFVAGAQALGEFDLIAGPSALYESLIERVLLLAGSLDGGGRVGEGLQRLKEDWTSARRGSSDSAPKIEYVAIPGSGHLPMIDQPERFCEVVGNWLASF